MTQAGWARSGDLFIAYEVSGSGPPDVVTVPGILNTIQAARVYPPVAELDREIARFARLIKLDKRGTGMSDRSRAIRCAHEIAVEAARLELEVRAGIHTGECERRGDDLSGIAVHIGARVAALAGGQEILVTSTVRDLVAGSGIEFEDRGLRALKGVPGEWQVLAVSSLG